MQRTNMILITNECIVDGCYKKSIKGKRMCQYHQENYDNGEILTTCYGQNVQKKEYQTPQKQS